MAAYDYNFHGTYDEFEGSLSKMEGDPANGTLSDGGTGHVFEADETLTNVGDLGPTSSTFYGVYVDGDVTIILSFGDDQYYAWINVDDPDTYRPPDVIEFAAISRAELTFCFLAGTRIATTQGAVAVESLRIGDIVFTVGGGRVPVKWIGRQSVVTAFGPPQARWPVLVRAGALGEGVPSGDLKVTSDHALLVDGVLIQAGALVNGGSVRHLTKAELGERYTVFHIETAHHDLVLAEGVPAETFVDNCSRRRFDNHAEYAALYGETPAAIAEIQLPRIKSARQVPRSIRALLEKRARAYCDAGQAVA
jgi:hypothetical protein